MWLVKSPLNIFQRDSVLQWPMAEFAETQLVRGTKVELSGDRLQYRQIMEKKRLYKFLLGLKQRIEWRLGEDSGNQTNSQYLWGLCRSKYGGKLIKGNAREPVASLGSRKVSAFYSGVAHNVAVKEAEKGEAFVQALQELQPLKGDLL